MVLALRLPLRFLVPLLLVAGEGVTWAQGAGAVDSTQQLVAQRQERLRFLEGKLSEAAELQRSGDLAGAHSLSRAVFLETPGWEASSELKRRSFDQYQVVVRQRTDEMARGGRVKEAAQTMEQFFADAQQKQVPAHWLEQRSKDHLGDLKDDDTYEVARTPQHVANADQVRKWLIEADHAAQLGRFDHASTLYAQVLNVDAYNTAARRGMEQVDRLVNQYYDAAYDQTRASFLAEITKQWESPVPQFQLENVEQPAPDFFEAPEAFETVRTRMKMIQIPSVEFVQTPLREVVEFLDARSKALDPSGQGVNLVLDTGGNTSLETYPISLRLNRVTLEVVLDYVAQLAGMKVRPEEFAVSIVPATALDNTALITKSYRVPPDFISSGSMGEGDDPFGANDPFAGLGGGGGSETKLQKRLTAKEFLGRNGVQFSEGATAQFIPSTSTLLVRNTQDQLDLVERLVEASFGGVAKLLKVSVKTLEIAETDLREIGFDWLLGQFNVPGSDRVFASGGTYGNTSQAPGANLERDYSFVPPGSSAPLGDYPVTSGNRTGGAIQFGDSVEAAINRTVGVGETTPAFTGNRTPGTFSVGGVFTDPQYQVVLRTLEQRRGNDIGATTTIVTRTGQPAKVEGIREFMYPSEYDPPEVPDQFGGGLGGTQATPFTPAHPTSFEVRELGTTLEVEGAIAPDGVTVDLSLIPEIVEFIGFIDYGSPIRFINSDPFGNITEDRVQPNPILQPVFRTIRENTMAWVYDGATVVIGGLVQDRPSMLEDRVPILGDTPLIGRFFRSKISQNERRAIIFFVTVNIVDPAGMAVAESQNTLAPGGE